jgi:hypothetical protein
MAEDKNIAIKVEIEGVEKSITTVKDLKDSIKKLQEQAENSDFGSESYKNAVEELDRLNASLKSVTQTEEQYAKSLQDIVKAEKEAIVESQDLRKQFEKLENELFLMAGQGKQNTKEFRALTVEAANLNKKIDAVNGSLGENSAGRASAGFAQLKDGLVNLDFNSVKAGLTAMKTALASTGIMLIVMAVSYLITNFEELSKGTGLLGLVLRSVGAYIQVFIDALTWFTDKIGLTTSELDAMRESMVANAEKAKEALGEQVKEYDRLIAVAKSNGESTVQIELDKQRAIQATNEMILRQMLAQIKSGVELDEAQKKLLTSTLASVKDTHTAITVIENTDRRDKAEKDKKAAEDWAAKKKSIDDKAAADKKTLDEKAAADKKIIDDKLLADEKALNEQRKKSLEELRQLKYKADNDENAANEAKMAADKVISDKKLAEHEAFEKDKVNIASNVTLKGLEAAQQLSDLFFAFKRRNMQKGSAEELAAAKKQFKINKALAITTATIQGVQGVLAAFSSGAAVPVVGAVLGPAYAVLAGVVAAANIAKIASAKFDEGGGGGGGGAVTSGGATPSVPIPSPPTLNTPGANTNSGTTFDSTGKNTSATTPTINVNATIGVDEINSKQNRVSVLEKQSTF